MSHPNNQLDSFLVGLTKTLQKTALDEAEQIRTENEPKLDERLKYFTTPAPNAIQWATRLEYMNLPSIFHHVRQYQVIRDFFQLRCPIPTCNRQDEDSVDCWDKPRSYLESENLLVWSPKYREDVCPKCGSTRSELTEDGVLKRYNQMHLVCGMRGGKSSLASVVGTYVEHRLINIGHEFPGGLSAYFDQMPRQPFEMTFTASTDVQAADTIWAKFVALRSESPWFQEYIKWVKKLELDQKTVNGAKPWQYEERDKYIVNGCLNLKINSLNSNCFVGDTKVLMADYKYKAIKDIVVGDMVIDKRGNKQTVENQWQEQAPAELVKIDTFFGRSIMSTKNHKFPVWAWPRTCACGCGTEVNVGRGFAPGHADRLTNEQRKLRHVDGSGGHIRRIPLDHGPERDLLAQDIRPGDFLMVPRTFDPSKPSISLDEARLFGYYISEGCHNRDTLKSGEYILHGTEFSFNLNEDMTYAEDVRSICNRLGIRHSTSRIPSRNVLVISTTNTVARKFAAWCDINGSHLSQHKALSEEVMRWPIEYKMELLKGMFRGDGTHYVGSRGIPSVSYTTASGVLAEQLQIILAHVGIYAGLVVHTRKPGKFNKNPAVKNMVNIGGIQCLEFADQVWGSDNRFTGYTQPKSMRAKCWVTPEFIYVPVKSVSVVKNTEPVFNLTVSNDHSYLVYGLGTYNSSGMAGRTRVASFIDELSRFDGKDSPRSADEAYRVLENSLRTVRSKAFKNNEVPWFGAMFSISSPISEDDKSMRLLKDAPRIRGMYYGHYATWEFNPDQPREMFDDDFDKDPIGAMRDFGAQPPTAASPLITDPNRFKEMAIDPGLQPSATFQRVIHTDRTGLEYVSAIVDSAKLLRDGERYIAFDAGASFDQFAAACVHGEWVDSPEGKQLVTVYDWVLRVTPDNVPRRDVWFEFVISMIERLRKYNIISRVNFDRWQSTYLIQQIRDRGIIATSKGTTVDMYMKFINDVNYGKVRMLPPLATDANAEPTAMSAQGLAFYELVRLERSSDLRKIYNPKKGRRRGHDSDDVAQVVAHANYMLQSTIADASGSNSNEAKLKREVVGGHRWEGGARLYRPPVSRRGW